MSALSNKNLKDKLSKISFEEAAKDFNCFIAKSGDYALAKKNFPYDDIENPVKSIVDTCNINIKSTPQKTDFIVIYGLGLGYILDESFSRYNSKIVVYEPDLYLLRFVFENVDLSHILSDKRVFISDDCNECCNFIAEHYLAKDRIDILYLKNYALIKPKELILLSNTLFNTCKSKVSDINTIKIISKAWIKNLIKNIKQNQNLNTFYSFDSSVKNGTALILSAGPSLIDNIEQIKTHRSKFTVFAISKVLPTLQKFNIIPDFIVFSDAINKSDLSKLSENYIKQNKVILDLKSDFHVANLPWKNIFYYFSNNTEYVNDLANKGYFKTYPAVGTSTLNALMCASKMGFKQIALCGFDLAFKNNTAYCDNSEIKIEGNSVNINGNNIEIKTVKSVSGENVKTRADFANFIPQCENNLNLINDDTTIFNITDFGAYIKGLTYTTFDQVLAKTEAFDLSKIINDTKIIQVNLQNELIKDINNIKELKKIFSNGEINFTKIYALKKSLLLYEYTKYDVLELVQGEFSKEQLNIFVENIQKSADELIDLIQENLLLV